MLEGQRKLECEGVALTLFFCPYDASPSKGNKLETTDVK
jgi:hypothetical protein